MAWVNSLRLHWLAEPLAAREYDAAHGARRYIAGENDRGDRAVQCLAKLPGSATTPSMPVGRL